MTHQQKLEKLRKFRLKLYEAEERLMTADNATDRWQAGVDYDAITCLIEDLEEATID
jgi:hypothetical protein